MKRLKILALLTLLLLILAGCSTADTGVTGVEAGEQAEDAASSQKPIAQQAEAPRNQMVASRADLEADIAPTNLVEINRVSWARGDLHTLEVDWIGGRVVIEPGAQDEILLIEYAHSADPEELLKAWEPSPGVLRVDFSDSDLLRQRKGGKWLYVSLPADMAQNLDRCTVDTVSASAELHELVGKAFVIDTVSGVVELSGVAGNTFMVDSVSGEVSLALANTPSSVKVDSVSGSVFISLPGSGDVGVSFDTVSGKLDSDFPVSSSNSALVEVETVSGSLVVKKAG